MEFLLFTGKTNIVLNLSNIRLYPQQGEDVAPKKDPVSTLQYLLGPLPKLIVSCHLLGVQLMSTNAYLHPSILYGQWEGWDGKPLDEPPLFYNGLTESAANLLSSVSDEIVNIGKALELKTGADMSNVRYIAFYLFKTAFVSAQYSLSFAGNDLILPH